MQEIFTLLLHSRTNKSAKELKPDVNWMQCAESTANYVDSTKNLIERIQNAEAQFGKAKCDEVLTQFSCWQLTQGERERAKKGCCIQQKSRVNQLCSDFKSRASAGY